MASARDLALDVLPHFARNVLARKVLPYGHYAHACGRDPEKESMIIGPAMHAIGAACVYMQIPVAPLFYVRRTDAQERLVFAADALEQVWVLPHYEILYVAAREHVYLEKDFNRIERVLREKIPLRYTPHQMWHVAVVKKPKNSDKTYFERALESYQTFLSEKRASLQHSGK